MTVARTPPTKEPATGRAAGSESAVPPLGGEGTPGDSSAVAAAARDDALEQLRAVAPRFADVLASSAPRRDVRDVRARLLLLLLRFRCPVEPRAAKRWYVPGAVARLGAGGLVRAWRGQWPRVAAPSERRLRDHVAAMERDLLLVRAPGEWLPRLHSDGRRSRWPDTFHLLESDEAAEWWESTGGAILRAHPEARVNPTAWRALVGDWRRRRPQQRELFEGAGELVRRLDAARPPPKATPLDQLRRAEALKSVACARAATAAQLLAGLDVAGVPLRGRNRELAQRDPTRLRGAAAVLAGVLRRGRAIANHPGFLVSVWRRAPRDELDEALEELSA